MDGLDLIYIRKVFSLFIYVTHERRYCDVIIIVVAWPMVGKCTVCVSDVRWH